MAWALVRTGKFGKTSPEVDTITNDAFPEGGSGVGELLVGFFSCGSDAQNFVSVTDNGTGTANDWQLAFDQDQTDDQSGTFCVWCVNQRDAGTLTQVTIHLSDVGNWGSCIVRGFTGNNASPFDGTNDSGPTGSHSSGTDVIASGTVAPSVAGDLIVGVCYDNVGAGVTAGTGFGDLVSELTGPHIYMAHRVEAGTASSQALFSDSGASTHVCGVVAFKPLGGAPPTNGFMWLGS